MYYPLRSPGALSSRRLTAAAAVLSILLSAQVRADLESRYEFNIPPQRLASALIQFSKQADVQVVGSADTLAALETQGVRGPHTAREALKLLLAASPVTYEEVTSRSVKILAQKIASPDTRPGSNPAARKNTDEPVMATDPGNTAVQDSWQKSNADQDASGNSDGRSAAAAIVVTGTRIKGVAPASPVVVISQEQMREAGQNDLGEVVRSVPLNFSGGQNPGVAQGASVGGLANQNLTGASALNLRGLGPDATLTLLNGRRLSYDAFTQAVDISTIPLAAVDSLQIVPDGASALYGSDAVAGVANIILKRDYEGVSTSAHFGTATDGGGFEQDYNAVGGDRWDSGGYMLAYQYERQLPVGSQDRDYTQYMPRPADLLAYERHNSVVATAHQDLASLATLSIDAVFNERWSQQDFSPASTASRYSSDLVSESYVVSPTLAIRLPGAWSLEANVLYGQDDTRAEQYSTTSQDVTTRDSHTCYCNTAKGAELDSEGPLVSLPGGAMRAAWGGGYRENEYHQYSTFSSSTMDTSRSSYYTFGELSVPLVAPTNEVAAIRALSFSAALRYEHYADLGGVTTPKLGIIYSPIADFDVKGSWGRSFKEPTLLQEHELSYTYVYPAALLGAVGHPASDDAMLIVGGNPNLRPERANTWSATFGLHPVATPAWRTELGYFNIVYRDRVIQPVTNLGAAFSNPAYSEFVSANPSPALQAQLIKESAVGLLTYPGLVYDPVKVVSLANDLFTNIAEQRIHGVDLSSDYSAEWQGGTLTLTGQASWLTSHQENSPTAPVFQLAGEVYNPPRLHARSGATWRYGALTSSAFVNYIGGVTDNRTAVALDGGSMTTVDLVLLYRSASGSGLFRGLDLALSVVNLTDRAPPYLRTTDPTMVTYDSTNYSALGRFVSLSIGKHW